jgi:methionyl-tRNA formyltransferase
VRLVFAGTPEPAVPSLLRLIASPRHEVVGVLTRPDAVSGRGRKTVRSPIGQVADEHGIPVLSPQRPSDPQFLDELRLLAPDCCPVVAYGALLKPAALAIPPLGWVNLHFSLLPAWRGAAPVQAAVAAGDEFTGASTFLIEEGLDTGPVFGVATERVRPTDTAGALLGRLAESGALLLESTMDALEDGILQGAPQSPDGVSYAPKVTVEDARIRWDRPALAVDRHIRSVTPEPGAWTTLNGLRLKVGPVTLPPGGAAQLRPGEVRVMKNTVLIGTATEAVALGQVQPQGKKLMDAAAWARGVRWEEETFAS